MVRTGTARGWRKGRANYYHLPYNGSFINDASVLKSLRNHWLCTSGMQLVMSIGYDCLRSIQSAAKTSSVMPQHGLSGVKSNSTKVTAAVLEDLNLHFDYLPQLGEVRATRMIATLVDGVAGCTNREEVEEMVYLLISMGYWNCYQRYMALLGYKVICKPNGAIVVEGEGGKEIDFKSLFLLHVIMPSGRRTSPS